MNVTGLWVPLVTPMYHGAFDPSSISRLVASLDSDVDGYVVALSSGEGEALTEDIWKQAIKSVVTVTHRPVAAGLLGKSLSDIIRLSEIASQFGCAAIAVPSPPGNANAIMSFFTELDKATSLPVIIYNTEAAPILDVQTILKLDTLQSVTAIKDSSGNMAFFSQMLAARKSMKTTILQGLENKLLASSGCDGYLISLGNLESALCKTMFSIADKTTNDAILQKFWEYNLGGEWYVSLKALLYSRGILRSSEQVTQLLAP